MADTAERRKARGAFFTPPPLSDLLTEWAVRSAGDRVLEPSCGEAAFLLSAGARLEALGARPPAAGQLYGVDIDAASVAGAARRLADEHILASIEVRSFFDLAPAPRFDAVIGNPPFVRYQSFAGEERAKARRAALAQGVRLDGLASSWAAFVVHAAGFLAPAGRLGLVLPSELLSVNYAGPVRRFLMRRFAEIRLVLFHGRVFPGVLEDVVLLLAEGRGSTDHCKLYEAAQLDALGAATPRSFTPPADGEKWVASLLAPEIAETYTRLATGDTFCPLLHWGDTDLGMVTGNNRYFALTTASAGELGLAQADLLRISPPGSRHLRGPDFGARSWRELARAGERVVLFRPRSREPSPAARRYIEAGERAGVPEAYKCRVRSPWWRVPLVSAPDLFFTSMNHTAPRLVRNAARVRHLNSVYGVTLAPARRALGRDLLPIAALNSVTLLGGELLGRAYGGGMLKLEPGEADRLPVPAPDALEAAAPALRALRPRLARHLRRGELAEAAARVDRALLIDPLRVARADVERVRAGGAAMFARRAARGRGVT